MTAEIKPSIDLKNRTKLETVIPLSTQSIMGTKHVLYLDSVRGIACMIVVFFHTIQGVYPGLPTGTYVGASINYNNMLFYPPFSGLIAGHASVCLFFILSGFVLSQRFLGEGGMLWKIIEAITKRPVRLVGVILFTLLPMFSFLLTKDFWGHRLWVDYDLYIKLFNTFIINIITMNILTVDMIHNPALWTIDVELWGSFLTFGLCLLIGNWPKMVRLAILVSLMLYFKNTYYVAFIFGILIADSHKNWNVDWFNRHKNMISYVIFIPAIILFSYQTYLVPEKQYWTNISFIEGGYSMLGAMLLFVFTMCNTKIKHLLEFKPLVFIGGISYSVYVLHLLILHSYLQQITGVVHTNLSTNTYLSFALIITITAGLIIFVSWLVDMCIDKPCIKLASWFGKKITKEIQPRIELVRNMVTASFRNFRGMLARVFNASYPDIEP